MCDQDHFEEDRQDYEALGLVTRRQLGVLVGAGVAMILPQVANAVAVADREGVEPSASPVPESVGLSSATFIATSRGHHSCRSVSARSLGEAADQASAIFP